MKSLCGPWVNDFVDESCAMSQTRIQIGVGGGDIQMNMEVEMRFYGFRRVGHR